MATALIHRRLHLGPPHVTTQTILPLTSALRTYLAPRTLGRLSHARPHHTPTRHRLRVASRATGPLVVRHAALASSHAGQRLLSEHSRDKRHPASQAGNADPPSRQSSEPSPSKPIPRGLEAARERTKAVRNKVRSSLTSLTPHENIYNLPNFLTVTRLFAAPATAYLLLHDQHAWALGLFAYAGITDLVDGWLARKWKLQTVAGSVMDPMADKALMIILTVTLAVKGAIPLYLATLILGRDASLAVAAIYYRFASLPAPKTFMRYWDFSLPSAEVHPTTMSKYNTFLQLILIGSTLALPVITGSHEQIEILHNIGLSTDQLHMGMTYFQWLVAGTTAWSGLSYAYLKNVVTILGSNEDLKAKQGARGRAIIGVTFGSCFLAAVWLALYVDKPKEEEEASSITP